MERRKFLDGFPVVGARILRHTYNIQGDMGKEKIFGYTRFGLSLVAPHLHIPSGDKVQRVVYILHRRTSANFNNTLRKFQEKKKIKNVEKSTLKRLSFFSKSYTI